ncbi:hypothetical protein [Trichormus azollae]|uniref:hypothetical protein n=1 Tax=Trichormus azollae TaxID=1164 RepID=UPI00325D2613
MVVKLCGQIYLILLNSIHDIILLISQLISFLVVFDWSYFTQSRAYSQSGLTSSAMGLSRLSRPKPSSAKEEILRTFVVSYRTVLIKSRYLGSGGKLRAYKYRA